jgi:Tol biopolymer transport system component
MLLRSRSLLLLLSFLLFAVGCRATSQLRIGRGIDHDLSKDDDDVGLKGDPGEEGEEGDAGMSAEPINPEATSTETATAETAPAPVTAASPAASATPAVDLWATPPSPEPVAVVESPAAMLQGHQLTSEGHQGVPAWSPDGAQVLFQAARAGGFVDNPWEQTWLMDASGERQRRITMGVGRTERPTFVPGRPGVVSYASTHHTGSTPTVGEAGAAAALRDSLEIYVQDLGQGSFTALTSTPGYDGDAAWCSNGSRVAFSSARDGDIELYTMASDGSDVRRITTRPGADVGAAWSPDCTQLAWSAETGTVASLMVAAADGTGVREVLGGSGRHERPTWMPNGVVLVFASDLATSDRTTDLFALALQGGGLKRLTAASSSERDPVIDASGGKVLYTSDSTGSPQLFVADITADVGAIWTAR